VFDKIVYDCLTIIYGHYRLYVNKNNLVTESAEKYSMVNVHKDVWSD